MTAVEKLAAEVIDIVLDSAAGVIMSVTTDDGKSVKIEAEKFQLAEEAYYQTEERVSVAIKAWLSQLLAEVTLHDTDTGGKT